MPRSYQWPAVGALFGAAVLGSIFHCSLLAHVHSWGDTLATLYCIPILFAGIYLGFRAALGVAVASGLVHTAICLVGCGDSLLAPLVQTVIFIGFAVVAGRLTRPDGPFAVAAQSSAQAQSAAGSQSPYPGTYNQRHPTALGQSLAALVHRLRTPVSSIEGAVELLDDRRCPDHKRQEFLAIIRKESHQLDRELCDVLDFAQPRRPQWRQVEVSQLLNQVMSRVESSRWPDYRFRTEVAPDLPLLTCDPEQVIKMLFNLVMNAIQSSPGGGQIAIAARAEADTIVISIQDHGRGIAPTLAGRIFDPFFTDRENALGLGLTVAMQIVCSHCGTISVMESSAKGTCVAVTLPLTPPDPHEHRPHSGG